jgi:hypothetical protein
MPRRRTSNRPIRRRIRLETMQDVQSELGKVYKAVDAGSMSPAEGTRRVFILDKLRASGLPDARARSGGLVPPAIQILSVPTNCFLSHEQIEAMKRGVPFVDIAQCTPIQPALLEHAPQLDADEQREEPAAIEQEFEPNTERERRLLAEFKPQEGPDPTPQLSALEEKLLAMGHSELLKLAEALDVGR